MFLWFYVLVNMYSVYSDLEEDPLFGDDLSPDSRLSGSDWLSSSPQQSPDHSKSEGKTEVHKIVNRYTSACDTTYIMLMLFFSKMSLKLLHCVACSFLCLVPDEAKSSYHVEGTGYDTYLRDAHRQVICIVTQRTRLKFFLYL